MNAGVESGGQRGPCIDHKHCKANLHGDRFLNFLMYFYCTPRVANSYPKVLPPLYNTQYLDLGVFIRLFLRSNLDRPRRERKLLYLTCTPGTSAIRDRRSCFNSHHHLRVSHKSTQWKRLLAHSVQSMRNDHDVTGL